MPVWKPSRPRILWHKSWLEGANQDVLNMARKIANRRAREEVLPLMAGMTGTRNMATLRHSWEAFRVVSAKGGYSFLLRTNDKDGMGVQIMKNKKLYNMIDDIAMESLQEAMIDSAETDTFIQSVLDEVLEIA